MAAPYSTFELVRAICDTDMEDAEITGVIEEVDAFMDLTMDTASIPALVLQMISRTMTTIRCYMKDPNASGLGEYNMDRSASLKKLNDELDKWITAAHGGIAFRYSYADLWWPTA